MIERKSEHKSYSCPRYGKSVIISYKRTKASKIELNQTTAIRCDSHTKCGINLDFTKCPHPDLKR
jgi:hypothetical protein